jgi:hypothetical protein
LSAAQAAVSPLTSETSSVPETEGMDQITMLFWQDVADSSSRWISVAEHLTESAELKPLLSTEERATDLCDPSKFLSWNDLVGER